MELGINLFCYKNEGEITLDRQLELMQANGFTHTFVMSDSAVVCDRDMEKIRNAGIEADTLHAPFRHINDMWKDTEDGDKMLSCLLDGVDKCRRYKVPVLVVHLSSKIPAPPITDVGSRRFSRLLDYARERNVLIAFENQRALGNISVMLEEHPDARFCWDVGHENCFTPGREYMPLFGNRVAALHIHDNNGIYDRDQHMLPFDGKLDFSAVAKHLAKADYKGTVMLEVFRALSQNYTGVTAEEYYHRAATGAKRIVELIENTKL